MLNQPPVFTVTQLNRHVRSILEYEVGEVWVEGEISNVSKPSSGHYYFTLKDTNAQIRCVYFRNRHRHGLKQLEAGMQIIAGGKLSLYEARGDFQLIVEELKEAGLGDLYRQFELLKTKLQKAGLFEPTRKKIIPTFPNVIGVITSPTGAAIQDILTTLARRFPLAKIKIYPSEVQGKQAASFLINAIRQANDEKTCDVLILARGGGSIEDLWAFNDEQLAYAISESVLPIVTGVGHETDFTIADFVADFRAATPTAAAETVTPNQADLRITLSTLEKRLIASISRFVQHQRLLLSHQTDKLTSPKRLIAAQWQALDYLTTHLAKTIANDLTQKAHQLYLLKTRLLSQNPKRAIQESRSQLTALKASLTRQLSYLIHNHHQKLATMKATLQAISPLATLDRGYAIVSFKGKVLFNAEQTKPGDKINVKLAKGELVSEVTGLIKD